MSRVHFANTSTRFISFYNEINIGADGWAMIAPFGDHPSVALVPDANGRMKKQNAIQRIDRAGAATMVAQFHNARKGTKKFLVGCNIYVGHPDVPGLENVYRDKEAKGVIADVAVRNDGIYGLPIFTNAGSDLVEGKVYRAFSGNIGESEADGEVNGLPAYRPTKLFSVGLTNTPHLPVHFFNSADTLEDTLVFHSANAEPHRANFANAAQRRLVVSNAVAEKMKTGLDYSAAFRAVECQNPTLFAGMKRVEITMPYRKKPITL